MELLSAVIALSIDLENGFTLYLCFKLGLTTAPPSSWDEGCSDEHHICFV